jgi:type IV pilus assembly protein PilY1
MKTNHLILSTALLALLASPIGARADDIDIYSSGSTTTGAPNLMVVIDNPSSQNNEVGACTYYDGTTPSNGSKALGNDQCSLVNVVHSMKTDASGNAYVNMGITTMAGVILPLIPIDDNTYSGTNASYAGLTNRQVFINVVKAISETSGKSGQGAEFQETWAYITGGNDGSGGTGTGLLSGTNYAGTAASVGCQKNYILYLSNVKANASHAQEDGETAVLSSAVTNAVNKGIITSAQGAALTTALPAVEKGYGREWTRFMSNVDINSGVDGSQFIITYSIATGDTAVAPAAITNTMEQFIDQVAIYGGGKYYPAGTSGTVLTNAILSVLDEVQSVNSAFSSSSLPVSVNTQGTYLNQVFMGMFRPDPSGYPRWMGNLKQYQFALNTTTNSLYLADSESTPQSAISSTKTGFISPSAISFWTNKDTTTNPDAASPAGTGGFWVNSTYNSTYSANPNPYDSPDGEVVEKGGAAYKLRMSNLTSQSSRNLYTYCPNGGTCNSDLTDSSNAFTTSNTGGSTSSLFGAASTYSVSSIVRTGTSALVTTKVNNGFSNGASVTIAGATDSAYNVTQNITWVSSNSFTISGLPDYPTSPSAGTYIISPHNSSSYSISSITRSSSSTSIADTETATVTTSAATGYAAGNSVTISGATPTDYDGLKTIGSVGTFTFTYPVTIYPPHTAVNTYQAVIHAYTVTISNFSKSGNTVTVTTSGTHGFHTGESVSISCGTSCNYGGTRTIASVPTTSTFTFSFSGSGGTVTTSPSPTVTPSTTAITLTSLTRTGTTDSATATATLGTSNAFTNGDRVDITVKTGSSSTEDQYKVSNVAITCSGACTSFTYPITTSPSTSVSGTSMQVALASATQDTIAAGNISRGSGASATTATITGLTASKFSNGESVDISASGSALSSESAYVGTWTISCSGTCTTATFGPVTLSPTTPATGTITAYSGSSPPSGVVDWVRGKDSMGDEASPGGTVTVRPSIHGDVLHSRPVVINYGGTTGVVVYYGANDGVFRAVNGNQTGTGAGTELWGFIPTEFYSSLNRLKDNSPLLLLPSTPAGISPTPQKKNYFADGGTGVYQKLNSDGTTATAYIYITMRRGGQFMYALDVTTPSKPKFLWKKSYTDTGMSELGQTWSQPKVAQIAGWSNPVLIFGAGYDTNEDNEPPTTDTMGRGIFILDAITGNLIWSATYGATTSCSGTSTLAACTSSDMIYSIPSDITLVDRDGDGKIDRLYAVDTGGNVWRVDLEPATGHTTPDYWQVYKLASLGCNTGVCTTGTPRKFFYPPDVIPMGTAGSTGSYDAVVVSSGDREHPLYSTVSTSSQFITNRFYMIKDSATGKDGSGQAVITEANLFDATSATYDNSVKGFYITFGTGEKGVNAPTTVAGTVYFGTNQATAPSNTQCTNLGIARGYRVNPFSAKAAYTQFDGGGLPPSPVAGLVDINGTLEPFIIGGGGDPTTCTGPDCKSAVGAGTPTISVSTKRTRTYWYKKK